MKFTTDYKLEKFILNTKWEDLPGEVHRIAGARIDQAACTAISDMLHSDNWTVRSLTEKVNSYLVK